MKRNLLAIVLVASLAMFAGCTSEPKDLTGQTFAPTTPDQVQLYQKGPEKYGIIGEVRLELTPDLTWDGRAEVNKVFDLMKAKAAAMGANGLLFEFKDGEYDINATAGYHGAFYGVPIRLKPTRTAIAKAIRVEPK